MMDILKNPITDRSAWRGEFLVNDDSWIVHLTKAMCTEIEDAATKIRARGLRATEFHADDFSLPTAEPVLKDVMNEVLNGRGFVLLRGLPVSKYDSETIRTIYWGIGCKLGTPVAQNLNGDLIAEIINRGLDVNQLNVKPSQTNAEQRPHTDPADVVTLLCINQAMRGGVSKIASTMTIYNEILTHHPEYLEVLYRGFHHDLRGDAFEDAPFGCTPRPIPIYRYYGGVLSCVFNASTIKDAQRRMGKQVPENEMRAVDYFVDVARRDDVRLDMEFQPGDIQLLNNYSILHWRTEFTDHHDGIKKRLLLRLWLETRERRPVAPEMVSGYITGAKTGASTSIHAGRYA